MSDTQQARLDAMAAQAERQKLEALVIKLFSHVAANENEHETMNSVRRLRSLLHARQINPADLFGVEHDEVFMHLCRARDELTEENNLLRKQVPAELLSRLSSRRGFTLLSALAEDKLGKDWRHKILTALGITKRRLNIWEQQQARIPDDAFLRLRAVSDAPDDPDPEPEPTVPPQGMEPAIGANALRAMSVAELAAAARQYIGDFENASNDVVASRGLPFGRIAAELRQRFKTAGRAAFGGQTQKAFLVTSLGRPIATINKWMSAAVIADDMDVPWSQVEQWAGRTGFQSPVTGADRIKAMRRAFDQQAI